MQHVWSGRVTRLQGGAGILFLENAFSNQSEEGKRNVFWPEAVVIRERRGVFWDWDTLQSEFTQSQKGQGTSRPSKDEHSSREAHGQVLSSRAVPK